MLSFNREARIHQMETANRNAKQNLICEQIRGELIKWNNQLKYLSGLGDKHYDDLDFHYYYAAKEFINAVNFDYGNAYNVFTEFISGMDAMEEKVNRKLAEMKGDYTVFPIDALIWLAKNYRLNPIIDFIDELEVAVASMRI